MCCYGDGNKRMTLRNISEVNQQNMLINLMWSLREREMKMTQGFCMHSGTGSSVTLILNTGEVARMGEAILSSLSGK